jgi:anti-sigma factor RsiW
MSRLSEAILMAYVDGELGVRERAAIEAEIAVDGDLAQRADRHRRLRALVQAAYDDDRAPAIDTPLVLPIGAARRKRAWWRRVWPFGR